MELGHSKAGGGMRQRSKGDIFVLGRARPPVDEREQSGDLLASQEAMGS